MTMYIQYFCKKFFSGAGASSSPSAVSGGGVRNSGLAAHQKESIYIGEARAEVVDVAT